MKTYWHTISDDMFAKMMMHNTRLRKGILPTGDVLSPYLPEGTILSPYSYFTPEQDKEKVWETVRGKNFPHLPSRYECFFLFEDEESIKKASEIWWQGQTRQRLRAQIREGSKIHKADAKWLDCTKDRWEENAHAYWRGSETSDPIFEVVVQGCVYFPDWEQFPSNPFKKK